jgi:hypothetical protein
MKYSFWGEVKSFFVMQKHRSPSLGIPGISQDIPFFDCITQFSGTL